MTGRTRTIGGMALGLVASTSLAAAIATSVRLVAQAGDATYVLISDSKISKFEQQLQTAADRGYRLVPVLHGSPIASAHRNLLLEKGPADAEPVEYVVRRGGWSDLKQASAEGFRFAGTVSRAMVLQRRKGTTSPVYEYVVVAARLDRTLENELRVEAAKGFHVVDVGLGVVFGILANFDTEMIALLERPVGHEQIPGPQYRVLSSVRTAAMQQDLQRAADDGFRLVPDQGSWGGSVLIEKPTIPADPIDYLLLSTHSTVTMQREMDKAAAGGYRFANTVGEGGREFVVAMQRRRGMTTRTHEQLLLATARFETMERELLDGLSKRFRVVGGMSYDRPMSFQSAESVVILERSVR
jgi:hypothetical protein